MSSKDRYEVTIKCPNCGNQANVHIVENDGWTFVNRGPEREISRIDGSISINRENITCSKCKHKWIDNYFE
jgi:hypothetical protein